MRDLHRIKTFLPALHRFFRKYQRAGTLFWGQIQKGQCRQPEKMRLQHRKAESGKGIYLWVA